MSQHEWFVFPTQPHLPPPDWPGLSQRLLDDEILLPADGQNVAPADLIEVSQQLSRAGIAPWIAIDPAWRTTEEVMAAYRAASVSDPDIALPAGLSMAETVACLRKQGLAFQIWPSAAARQCAWGGARQRLGPGAYMLFDDREAWAREEANLSVTLLAFDGIPHVTAGENLCVPMRPGTDRPIEELAPYGTHVDFIGAAYEDPAATWTDPETGKSFHILDLDWSHSLGVGYRYVMIEGGGSVAFVERFALRLSELLGQPTTFAHLHL